MNRPALDLALRNRITSSWRTARTTNAPEAWTTLAEAHILSQPWATLHVRTHLEMLRLAVRSRDPREVVGQAIRVIVAAPGSLTGRYPIGNTGRSNVSMFEPMPVPDELAELLPPGASR